MRIAVVVDPATKPDAVPTIIGFVCTELYRGSRCGLVSYLGVDRGRRQKGTGHRLLEHALDMLWSDANDENQLPPPQAGKPALGAIFAEVHDPEKRDPKGRGDVMEPMWRFSFFAKQHARKIPIDYVQPPLANLAGSSPNAKEPAIVETLALLTLPIAGKVSETLDASVVKGFLDEYFGGQDPRGAVYLKKMKSQLDKLGPTLELLHLHENVERPQLTFPSWGIAFHFVSSGERRFDEGLDPPTEPFLSYERDVLAYAYRDETRPFATTTCDVDPALQVVDLSFASELTYSAEGQTVALYQNGKPPVHRVDVRACVTRFKAGIAVGHLVLSPHESSDDKASGSTSALNEYEVIKLIKVWEGGEDMHGPLGADGVEQPIVRLNAGNRPLTVFDLAEEVFESEFKADPPVNIKQALKAGTVRLEIVDYDPHMWTAAEAVSDWAKTNKDEWEKTSGNRHDGPTRMAVESIAGIVQGLIDFHQIGADELTQVFKGIPVENGALGGLHKGTLVTVQHEDRDEDMDHRAYPVSPYKLVPQAVLIHNEALLDRANEKWKPTQSNDKPHELEVASRTIHTALDADFLPNVFHYESEKELYKTGHESRGINERVEQFRRRLADVDARYDLLISQKRNHLDDARTLFLLVISVVSIKALWDIPAWSVVVLVGLMVALYWGYLRLRAESKRMRIAPGLWNALKFLVHKNKTKQPQ